MNNIRYLQSQLDRAFRDDYSHRFPGFERPQIVPGRAIAQATGYTYLSRYIDQEPDSFYLFIRGNVANGDVTREKACELVEDFFYEKMGMQSSYDIEDGGDLSRKQAIDKEVLPAKNDSAYKTYYEEQMEALQKMMQGEEQPAEQQAATAADDDVIDVTLGADGKYSAAGDKASTKAVGAATTAAVAMPKPIIYGVCFHIPAGGGMLSMGGSGHLGHHGHHTHGYLHEEDKDNTLAKDIDAYDFDDGTKNIANALREIADAIRQNKLSEEDKKAILDECDAVKAECEKCGDPECKDGEICGLREDVEDEMMQEVLIGRTVGAIAQHILDAIGLTGCKEGVGLALADVYEKFFGPLPTGVCENKTVDEKHVEGIDNVIDELGKVKTLDEAILTPQDQEDIADMFAGYSSLRSSEGNRDARLARFMRDHASELKSLVAQYSTAGGLGDFSRARDMGNDDMNEDDLLKGRKHNAHIDEVYAFGAHRGYFIEFETVEGDDYPVVYDEANAPKSVYRSKAEADRDAKKFSILFTKDRTKSFEDDDFRDADFIATICKDDPINDPSVTAIVRHGDEWSSDVVSVFVNGVAKPDEVLRLNVANVNEEDEVLDEGIVAHSNWLAKEIW